MDDLYRTSGAAQFGLTFARFQEILNRIADRHLEEGSPYERRQFWAGLRLTELALAWGCAEGNEGAWERFVELYRGKLHGMALSLTRDDASAREIAGSLFGDLFACRLQSDAPGRSRFESYSGRGSLEGWLRAVMAREYTNRIRRGSRTVSFEGELEAGVQFTSSPVEAPIDLRLAQAVDHALASLTNEDRFLLASYYLEERTMSAISRCLGVHESTVSRKLERIKRRVRSGTMKKLRAMGIDARNAEQMLSEGSADFNLDLRRRLAGASQ